MTDPLQIENLISNLRMELQSLGQRAEVFGMLPAAVREPILDQLQTMIQGVKDEVVLIRQYAEAEISRQRGDEMEDYRTKFRQATGG